MRASILSILSVAALAHGQHGGHMGARAPGIGPVGHGFGSVVFPGTGVPGSQGHISALGATVRGVAPVGGYGGYGGYAAPVMVPYAVPIGMPYQMAAPAPNVTVINTPSPAPTVIINQNYTPERPSPVMRDYSGDRLPETSAGLQTYQAPIPNNAEGRRGQVPALVRHETDDKPTIYLLALKDGAVYSCYAFWRDGDTVHYVTTRQVHNKVSAELVDMKISERLNVERNVEFPLD